MRANHDCQFLFTKNHALAIIHYVMKYISKPEAALHSKLTIAAAVRKALPMISSSYTTDLGRQMILKTYNKLDSHREVGIPEAISHLLGFPDHYTDKKFQHIHTTHLLQYFKSRSRKDPPCDNSATLDNDSRIIVDGQRFSITSYIDDYAYRGESLSNYCLYDYYSRFYKWKKLGGIRFDPRHQQHLRHTQFLRRPSAAAIPNLLGKLMFLNKDSLKQEVQEDYYCLIAALFFPWNFDMPLNSDNISWKQFFHDNQYHLSL